MDGGERVTRRGYSRPLSVLIRLNLDERIACSGEHAEEPVKPAGIVPGVFGWMEVSN